MYRREVAARNSRTLDILWRYFYLPKRTREHAARFLERIDRRLFKCCFLNDSRAAGGGWNQHAFGPAAKSSNLHDPVFPLLLQEFTSHAGLQAELARSELRPTELQNLDMERDLGSKRPPTCNGTSIACVISPRFATLKVGRRGQGVPPLISIWPGVLLCILSLVEVTGDAWIHLATTQKAPDKRAQGLRSHLGIVAPTF